MPPAPSMPPPGPVAAPAEPVGPEPASTPPAVDPPATTCEIHTEYWYSHGPRTLRSESGRAYGTIRHADEMRLTTAGGAAVEFTSLGLRLRMRKHAGDVPVYPRRELVFADVLQAGLGTPLGWSAVEGPRLRVAPPRDRRVRFVSAPALEVDCEALTLESGYSDVVTADRRLRPRGPIAVAATPGGPAVLHLHLPHAVEVQKIEVAGSLAKIAWPIADGGLSDATVRGWVDARLLAPLPKPSGGEMVGGALGLEGTSHWTGCGAEHPLYVDAGGGPEVVGEILAGTRVKAGARRGVLIAVEVIGQATRMKPTPIMLRPGARFLLDPAAAEECSRGA